MFKPNYNTIVHRERNLSNLQYPKGFDINLLEVISEYNLDDEQIKQLGLLTANHRSGLAHASVGKNVFYRRKQIEGMLNVEPVKA